MSRLRAWQERKRERRRSQETGWGKGHYSTCSLPSSPALTHLLTYSCTSPLTHKCVLLLAAATSYYHPPRLRHFPNIMCTLKLHGPLENWCPSPDNITAPNGVKCGAEFDAAPMRWFGWVRVGWGKKAPYFFYWVGPFLIS